MIGLIAAAIILAFTFGTLVAMGLPLVSAVLGLIAGLSLITVLGHGVTVPTIAPTLATMIGLGVGIDYALFLVTRHRDNRKQGMEMHESIAMAVATSGSAIVFAGTTVVIALLALLVAGIPLVTSLGYSSAVAVVTAVLAALTLLPAVMAIVGKHIESARLPTALRPSPKDVDRGFWGGWARALTRRPWWAILGVLALLIPLIVPFLSLNLGQEDIGATPKSTTERQAYDLLSAGFGVGYNGPLLVAVDLGSPAKQSSEYTNQYKQAQSLQKQLEQEQKSGKTQQQQLQAQANSLTAQSNQLTAQQKQLEQQQNSLEAQQAALERQAKADKQEQKQIQASANKLEAEQVALNKPDRRSGRAGEEGRQRRREDDQEADLRAKELTKNQAEQKKVEKQIEHTTDPSQKKKLESKLSALQKQETKLEKQLEKLVQEDQANREASQALLATSQSLRKQEVSVANRAISLAGQSATLASDAVALVQQKHRSFSGGRTCSARPRSSRRRRRTSRRRRRTCRRSRRAPEPAAERAEPAEAGRALKNQLTDELTKAGGDARGTDPRLVNAAGRPRRHAGRRGGLAAADQQDRRRGDLQRHRHDRPAAPATADLVRTLRDVHDPAGDRRRGRPGVRRRADGEQRRPRRGDLVAALPGDRTSCWRSASSSCCSRSARCWCRCRPRSPTCCAWAPPSAC